LKTKRRENSFMSIATRYPKKKQSLPVCPFGESSVKMKMSIEHWWNDSDMGKTIVHGEKRASVLLHLLQILRGLGSNSILRAERTPINHMLKNKIKVNFV
jgi:hypothetical protein